jgi:4-carboxymuconolactone decarboxylase
MGSHDWRKRCTLRISTPNLDADCDCRDAKTSMRPGGRSTTALPTPKVGRSWASGGPGGILLHSPDLSRYTRRLNYYLRREAGLGGRVRELAILTTARELDSQFEWAAHEPEALREGISREIIEIIQHRLDTSGLDRADAIVIELAREVFGARKVASETFARALRHFGRRALVDLVVLMGNYAGTAALLTAFDMQLNADQPSLSQDQHAARRE